MRQRCSEPTSCSTWRLVLSVVFPSLPIHFLKRGYLCLCEQISEKSNLHQRYVPGKLKRDEIGRPHSLFSLFILPSFYSFYLSFLCLFFSCFLLSFVVSQPQFQTIHAAAPKWDLRTGDTVCFLHLLSLGINGMRDP